MATVTRTYTESASGSYRSTWTLVYSAPDIVANGTSFVVSPPSLSAKFVYSSKNRGEVEVFLHPVISGATIQSEIFRKYRELAAMASGTAYNIATSTQGAQASVTIQTASIFNSSNPTVASVPIQYVADSTWLWSVSGSDPNIDNSYYGTTAENIFSTPPRVTLNAPPAFDTTQVSVDTPYIYSGLTTASVTVSNSSAQYGGTVSDITLTIGNQTTSRSTDGTLSILLDTVGTFTPTVKVTDSRGQTTTKSLNPITVNGYVAPSVSFSAERTTQAGIPDDEGTYATLDATFTFTDVVATLLAPSVTMTDENGTQTTPTVTWYSTRASDGTLSGTVDWSTISYGDTAYCLVAGLNTNYSYQISVRPRDDMGTGTAIVQTVASAFYTIDFLAGGHGIAFGKPASHVGFDVAMDTTFEDNVFISLPDYQTADTTDKAIYDAIVVLGWDSDVLVN